MPPYEQMGFGGGGEVLSGDRARGVFGHVMELVACTLACTALGAYVARNLAGGGGILFFILAFGCLFGLNAAAQRGHEQLSVALLFAFGLLLGLAVAPVLDYYAKTDPTAVYQAAGATALGTGALGAFGYTTRRDLSTASKFAFFALLALLVFGLVAFFVAIPGGNIIYCVAGIAIFSVFTAADFQRLARKPGYTSAVPIAAAIFLDIFNMFLLLLNLFGGGGGRR
jgi:uncharacterized protein